MAASPPFLSEKYFQSWALDNKIEYEIRFVSDAEIKMLNLRGDIYIFEHVSITGILKNPNFRLTEENPYEKSELDGKVRVRGGWVIIIYCPFYCMQNKL